MVSDIRQKRLAEVVQRRVAAAILQELKDPRLGFVTVTGVKLARDLTMATVFWSIIGTAGDRSKTAHALEASRPYLQTAVFQAMGTRISPRLYFKYDPSMEKAQKVFELLAKLKQERIERGEEAAPLPDDSEE